MAPTALSVALPDDLVAWMEEVGGGRLVLADRRPGGGRKEAWFVDLERPDGSVAASFLRYDRSDPAKTKDPWTLHREATVYLASAGHGGAGPPRARRAPGAPGHALGAGGG